MPESAGSIYTTNSRLLKGLSAKTTSGNAGTTTTRLAAAPRGLWALAELSNPNTGDVLDLWDFFVQTKIGSDWYDVIHFTQATGTGGAKNFIAKLTVDAELDTATGNPEIETGTALNAGEQRHIFGDEWRTRWEIVDGAGAGTHSFTFNCSICPF